MRRRCKIVTVEGVVGLRKALKNYAPGLKKELDKDLRAAVKPVLKDAKSRIPSNWPLQNWNNPGYDRQSATGYRPFPDFDQSVIRQGLTYSLAKKRFNKLGFTSMVTLFNNSAPGSIIETAGRKSGYRGSDRSQSNNPDAGRQFIASMNQVGGLVDFAGKGRETTGRLLYAAYDRNQGKALDAIMEAIGAAKKVFERQAAA